MRAFWPETGKDVEIESEKIGQCGREVGKVLLDGKDVKLAMVAAGLSLT